MRSARSERRREERGERKKEEGKKDAFAGSRTRVASLEGLQAAAAPQTLAGDWKEFGFEPSRYMLGNAPARSVVCHTQKSDESGIRTHALSEQSLNLPP